MIIHKKYAIILDKYSKRSYNYSSMITAEVNMKKIISAVLIALMLLSIVACDTTVPPETTQDNGTTSETAEITTEKETDEMTTDETTDVETEEPIVDEDPVFYEKTDRDPVDPNNVDLSKTDWNATITNAAARADGVSGKFIDTVRNMFEIRNQNMSLIYNLTEQGNKQVKGLYNADGKAYFNDTMDAYVINSTGTEFSSAHSLSNGRMNSNRIGYYYYDFRFRDQTFIQPTDTAAEEAYDLIAETGKWAGSGDVKKITKKNGTLSYTVTGALDPNIYSATNFSADKYNAVRMTIKTEYSSSVYFYIIAGSQKQFNQDQSLGVRIVAGQWYTIIVPMSAIPDYTGSVTGFRVDCGYQSGEKIEISELKAISVGDATVPLAMEHIFHTYSDKMHEVVRAVATADYKDGGRLETRVVIPEDTVRKIVLKNKNGETSTLEGFDFSSTEYVGFDVKGVGVYGIIMPVKDNNGYIKVEAKDGNYVISRGIEITGTIKKGGDIQFGHRVYTTTSHQFNDLRKEAYIERNPLTDVYIFKTADDAKFLGYDALTGSYVFSVKAIEFSPAMYSQPNKHFKVNALFCGDGVVDRTVYVETAENRNTRRGRLECAAMLDENGVMLPMPLEVGKNFDGENEEPLYFPENATGAAAYGETYVPITVGKDENKQFTMLHLYQNWGNYPLKQISFIAFHIPYYHLSVGVTETNCITPYYVYGKDGFVLPDFRSNSAPLWDNNRGTQHTSMGRNYFLQYKDADGNHIQTEYQVSDLVSTGPIYADVRTKYLSDDGKIKATYRHTEMAQTDENRTYYTIRLEVLDDVSFKDFRNDFAFFTTDSRDITYAKVGYLDENGNMVIEDVKIDTERTVKLGKEYPYFDYFGGSVTDSVNFGLIVKRADITIGGKKFDGNFIFRDKYDGSLNVGSLSLDLGEVTLKKGDVIDLDIILLPWGYSTSKNDDNVRNVRADSCIDPYKVTAIEGETVSDNFIPSVRAKNNTATFKLSGGKGTCAVRVYGFSDYKTPTVTFKADGKDTDIKLAGVNGYDGYQVYYDEDGTYSFSFNVDMDKASEYEITIKQ